MSSMKPLKVLNFRVKKRPFVALPLRSFLVVFFGLLEQFFQIHFLAFRS